MDNPVLINAIYHYGEKHQISKAIEEMAELTVELAKRQNDEGLRVHLLNKIADASIMIEQLKLIFGAEMVSNLIEEKGHRLHQRVEEERLTSGAI